MPVPWQALIPPALMTTMFAVTGTLLNVATRAHNLGQPPRYGIDDWDKMMMTRDRELTGHKRGQSDDPTPPPSFKELKVEYHQ